MSLWDAIKKRLAGEADDAAEEQVPADASPAPESPPHHDEPSPATPDELAPLERLGSPGGPSEPEVLRLLTRARGTLAESRAISAVMASGAALSEPIAIALAELFVLRGEDERALLLLRGASSAPALMLLADLHAERSEYAHALGAIERVLARDLSAPGAIERHARLLALSGAQGAPRRHLDEATLITKDQPETSFRILREIARGGAGTVYEALDDYLGRKVAFKVHHRGAEDRVVIAREAKLLSRFAGRGVVRVLDAAPESGWIAFEWVAAGSLREWLRAGRSDVAPVLRWALPLARALARVHEAGFVHGDVKPANVLMRSPSEPLLTDFGIAGAIGDAQVGGSVGYMSPERLSGKPLDPRDDVYGFGRVLEDVLDKGLGAEPLRAVVTACLGPREHRPASGQSLRELLAKAS